MNLKEKLTAKLNKLNARRDELMASIVDEENKETRAAMGATLTALKEDIAEVEEMLAQVDEPAGAEGASAEGAEGAEGRGLSVVGTMQTRNAKTDEGTGSLEYRKAFKDYMATGKMTKRADETTGTADVGVVIPENLVNKILEKFEELGTIYNLVTHTAFAVGQSIPTDSVKPTATWVAEGASSDAQKKGLGALITFAAYKLRCEIRFTEEVSVMTLSAFEALFVKQVGEAMLRAKEQAIISGDGNGKPTGILTGEVPEGQAIEVPALTYAALCDAEAALPEEYEANAKWAMTKKMFMKFIAMVDDKKQPIARVNYGIDGKPERYLLGREVICTRAMANQSVDAMIYDFSDYILNTNYNLGIKHAQDWDNEDHKTKAVEACDGKSIDNGSLVTLKVTA
jgi:HK97 family phage major capsid protein